MATVIGAPIRSAMAPAPSAPKGPMPTKIIEWMAMTRPRGASGTIDETRQAEEQKQRAYGSGGSGEAETFEDV